MMRKPREENVFLLQQGYLRERFGKGIIATRYGQGCVNINWLVKTKSEEIVARFYPPFFNEKLETELWVLRELDGCDGRVPRLLDVDVTGFSVPVLFMSKLPGDVLKNHGSVLDHGKAAAIINELHSLLDTVAEVPVSVYGYLHDPLNSSSVSDYIGQVASRYLTSIKHSTLLEHEQICILELSLRLLQDMSLGRKACLSYPDLSFENILIHNGCLSGLVDWEFVMGFEPLYGFGNFLLEICSEKLPCMTPRMFVECFPVPHRKRLVLLAFLRVAELLSYLPSTILYDDVVKKKLIYRYIQDIVVLQELLDSL